MQSLTEAHIQKLATIWGRMCPPEWCKKHFQILIRMSNDFYKNLEHESLEKEANLKSQIKELEKEVEGLYGYWEEHFKLPKFNKNQSLFQQKLELKESVDRLRENLNVQRNTVNDLLMQQKKLCQELGEPPQALIVDPLPSEKKIQEFQFHLEYLKEMQAERSLRVTFLRRQIKKFNNILNIQAIPESEEILLNRIQITLDPGNLLALHTIYDQRLDQIKQMRKA